MKRRKILWTLLGLYYSGYFQNRQPVEMDGRLPVNRCSYFCFAFLFRGSGSQTEIERKKWQRARSYSDECRYEFGVINFDFNLMSHLLSKKLWMKLEMMEIG